MACRLRLRDEVPSVQVLDPTRTRVEPSLGVKSPENGSMLQVNLSDLQPDTLSACLLETGLESASRVTRQVDELFLGLGDPVSVGLRINAANSVLQQQPGY